MKNRKRGIKFIGCIITAASLLAGGTVMPVSAGDTGRLAAFPGAEGGGMYASGARGAENIEIYHVTNLNDSGKGSLRDAVSQSDRIIVFDVAGNIELVNALSIIGDNLTILGQTAPGDGICIKNNTVGVFGDNVIIRYLRFRMGDELTVEDDSIGGRGLNNVIIDHCSISWSVDECASFYENTNFTMQWCIVAESLKESVHGKGTHGYGGIWGGQNTSYHHNLLAHHDSRNPRIATAGIEAAKDDVTMQTDLTDLRNNVIYNWGGNSAYGGENGAPVNIVNCYYKPGPSTGSGKRSRLFQITAKAEGDTTGTNNLNCPGWGTDLYVSGNYVYGSDEVTNDNTKGVVTDSNTTTYGLWTDSNITEAEKTVHNRYITDYPVTTQTAEEAYMSVLAGAGASIARDSVDTAIVNDVINGTGSLINTPSEGGGYPELSGTKAKDTDNDGIPNEWEDAHGLDKYDKSDALTLTAEGYTRLEEYANALADGSYVRNTAYDPDVPDYVPEEETEAPDSTPAPEMKLVDQWIAAAGDESKAAGTELMQGLTNVIELTRAMTDTVTFEDGSVFNYAISHKDTNGKWSNGTATGTA
ncbi:MAG: polysaccharide lyase family 1 protein, partial [Candidatus Ornithomonoglobus sp.]